MKLLKIFAWIMFFPFMLTHWGWKQGKKPAVAVGALLSAIFIFAGALGTKQGFTELEAIPVEVEEIAGESGTPKETVESPENEFVCVESDIAIEIEGHAVLVVDGGDLSGDREPNVVVDIGFGERDYYAFTNEYGQLVKVVADEIILQDDAHEPVLSTGRYYRDEAKVPGVESPVLDEGHVIADSLGGVSNAYNITPQNSTLNRHGDQAYMEDQIREAGGCTNFVAIITYPDTETQIPSHYDFTYTLKGKVIHDAFDNVNPDEVNAALAESEAVSEQAASAESESIGIKALDKKAEYVVVENPGASDVDLSGWTMVSEIGSQSFVFPAGTVLEAGESFKLTSYEANGTGDFIMAESRIWNNSENDPAVLYDANGVEIDRLEN